MDTPREGSPHRDLKTQVLKTTAADGDQPVAEPSAPGLGRRLALNTAIVGSAFVLSRVLGLVREMVIGAQFGTSEQKDAYVAAFRVPDTLFLLFIGGAVGSAFIPVFTSLLRTGKERQAWHLASTLINASVVVLSLLGILAGFAAPGLVATLVAPGLPPERHELVAELTRILLLSPLFLGLGGWAMGILNARQHFVLPALAPIFYNLSIIAGALFLAPHLGIHGVAWGVVVGALLHFGVQVPGLVRAGMQYAPRLNVRDEGVGEVSKLLVPRLIGQAAFQANIVVITNIASFLPAGRIAALDYAYLLMLLPHGVFAMSLATVTFPTMSAQFAEKKFDAMRSTLTRAIGVLLFLTIPAAIGLFALRSEIVTALFQFGAFTRTSTELVASALAYFALGLVSYAVVEILTRGFYALHDTATPVSISVATVLFNIGLSIILVRTFGWGHEGLALSLAVSTTAEMLLMWVLLNRKLPGGGLFRAPLLTSILKSSLAAAAMGAVLLLLMPLLRTVIPGTDDKVGAALLMLLGITLGAGAYIIVALLLRSEELRDSAGLLLRRVRR